MNGTSVFRELWISARHTVVSAAMTILFTLLVTGVGQLFFTSQANGSLLSVNGAVIGSTMIGQSCPKETLNKDGSFSITIDPMFFQGRLSYTTDPSTGNLQPCNAASSAGSNFGPSSPLLVENAKAAVAAYRAHGLSGDVPVDLVTSDFTGFDPDISEAAALFQVPMVAQARGLDPAKLTAIVESQVQGRILWVFGEPHVNVLQLNLAAVAAAG